MTTTTTLSAKEEQTPHFIFRILQLTWVRVCESRETRAYTTAIAVSTVIGIILEAFIAVAHADAARDVWASVGQDSTGGPSSPLSRTDAQGNSYLSVLVSIQRLKDENVFFALFQVFQLYLGMDAIVRQSVIQLIAHTVNSFISVVLALVQLGETLNWNGAVYSVDQETGETTNRSDFYIALRYEIVLAATMAVLTAVFACLCAKLSRQFGWNMYKRLGADPSLQARFRLCQVFLLSLKLDGFFQLVFSIFWFVVMTQENYQHGNSASVAWYVLHLLLTIVQFPAPFVARYGLCSERPPFMIAFVIVHVLIVVDFIIVLQQSVSSWVFWVLAVCLAIALSLITIVLAVMVTRNFGKGLKPYVQRLFDKNYRYKFNPAANPTFINGNKQSSDQSSWAIEDD